MPKHEKGASDQSTLVTGFACCFILQDQNVESSYFFQICQCNSGPFCKCCFAQSHMSEKILAKHVSRIVRKRLTCSYHCRFSVMLPEPCKTGNNLHKFDLSVSSRYTEQFHNKNQNCLIAFPIDWRCVLKNLVQSTQNCNTVSRQRIRDVISQSVGFHKLKVGHCRNLFLL